MSTLVQRGSLSFSIESRILRELGERLVRQPEVALLELIKNAYDADARTCTVNVSDRQITVADDGVGMTLDEFTRAWMRIGTSSKERRERSSRFQREITGEKGIGRFAVRFLGRQLQLVTIADDPDRGFRTRLQASFNWPRFDRSADLGAVQVPYRLTRARAGAECGTTLTISALREGATELDWRRIRTGSVGVVSAVRALLTTRVADQQDTGFSLVTSDDEDDENDLAEQLLDRFALRARVRVEGGRLLIRIYRRGDRRPYLSIDDRYPALIGRVRADIRFYPRRAGTFTDAEVDGRTAYGWVRENSGVKVFDRGFQVQPYGEQGDDWLHLVRDAARNERHPQSSVAQRHFPMTREVAASPATNWMLRLPESAQLIGAVEVRTRRTTAGGPGLVAAADREGFVANEAYDQLVDIMRGAVEMMAVADRQIQQEEKARADEERREEGLARLHSDIEEIRSDPTLTQPQKERIVAMLAEGQALVEREEAGSREREQRLEVMSLLGVIGGFMTHEFGTAIAELRETRHDLQELARTRPEFAERAEQFGRHIAKLEGFVSYSELYIRGARGVPSRPYPVRPRLTQVRRLFDEYARDRGISVEIDVEAGVTAPRVPVSLYNGIAQNLLTNALKALTAATEGDRRTVAMRAWNQGGRHHLQVSDTGIGIPGPAQRFVFDPLFTTTDNRRDPLGTGMGLGLALVKRGAEVFGGNAALVTPPPGFSTCVEVTFPIEENQGE